MTGLSNDEYNVDSLFTANPTAVQGKLDGFGQQAV